MIKPRISISLQSFIALALLTRSASAQGPRPIAIEQVHVGLPTAAMDPDSGHTRHGAWAPVYVKIKVGTEAIAADSLRLVAESNDSEDTAYQYSTPLPGAAPDDDVFAITYLRPGSTEVNISLQTAAGKSVSFQIRAADGRTATVSRVSREFGRENLAPTKSLYLSLGSHLSNLRRAILPDANANLPDDDSRDDKSPWQLGYLDNVRDLPDRWYGYDAVDIVVLNTSRDTFVNELRDQAATQRRKALGEWVRRGGKLIVGVGRNRQLVAELLDQMPLSEFDKQPLINCKIEGAISAKDKPALPLSVTTRWATTGRESPPPLQVVELTGLQPNARPDAGPLSEPVNVLIREVSMASGKEGPPVVVHAACGLGRVVLVGFDLDTPPFSTWPGQKAAWEKLGAELAPRTVIARQDVQLGNFQREDDLGAELKGSLESFKEVPVISFGWVALFILVYIVIVGPLDYLILKKVFKRLELTWITFPTVVLVVSVAAYFTAYSLKGDDLRINKIDVFDLDLHGAAPQAYGTTWVALFSPRIQNYTVGLEAVAPPTDQPEALAWVDRPSPDARAPRPVVTVMEGAESMSGRMGSQGLFRRAYDYAPDASGLENVSIPVWSIRTFTARWRAPVTPGKSIAANLRHSRDKNDLALLGRITNNLPIELRDVTLVYQGKTYPAGTVAPDSFLLIDNLKVGEQGKPVAQWLNESAVAFGGNRTVTGAALMRDLLFHSPPGQSGKSNGDWHALDQSWRLRPLVEMSTRAQPQSVYRDEVMLVARVPSQAAASEAVTRMNASPTRLWLDVLPGTGAERRPLSGYIVQDVYVRVYIPVTP